MSKLIKVKPGLKCRAVLTAHILRLKASRAYRAPLTEPTCKPDTPPGLVTRTFRYPPSKGRGQQDIKVTLHAKAMVGLLKAMKKQRSIRVTASSTSPYSGSYRTYEQQLWLYQEYKAGRGYKAASPCYGYHRRGRAVDLLAVTDAERKAMLSVRVDGLRFYDGLSFGDPPHFTLGARG